MSPGIVSHSNMCTSNKEHQNTWWKIIDSKEETDKSTIVFDYLTLLSQQLTHQGDRLLVRIKWYHFKKLHLIDFSVTVLPTVIEHIFLSNGYILWGV